MPHQGLNCITDLLGVLEAVSIPPFEVLFMTGDELDMKWTQI